MTNNIAVLAIAFCCGTYLAALVTTTAPFSEANYFDYGILILYSVMYCFYPKDMTFNSRIEHRRVFECSTEHGPIMIIESNAKDGPVSITCPLCGQVINKSRPIDIVDIRNIELPVPPSKTSTL